jgi:hypothetical protein
MDVKTCRKCHQPKPLDQFYANRRDECHRSRCKDCLRDDNRKWRTANRSRHNARAMKWYYDNPGKSKQMNTRNYKIQNEKRNQVLSSIFNDHPCFVCGDTRHGCLSFHHLDPREKEYGVTSHSLTWKKMLKEAAKCVVLCLNCHTLYHRGDIQLPKVLTPIDTSKYLKSI